MSTPDGYDYQSMPIGYYDDVFHRAAGVQSKWHHLKFKRIAKEIEGFERHLDIGCGPGTFIGGLECGHCSLGVDIAIDQIAYAADKYGERTKNYQVVAPGPLPFPDGVFDAATLIELIEHLAPSAAANLLEEAARVLKPGGKLVVSTPNYGGPWPAVEAIVNKLGKISYEDQHINRYDRKRLSEEFSTLDLAEFRVSGYMFASPFTAFLGWGLADLIEKLEPEPITKNFGLLLLATGRKAP